MKNVFVLGLDEENAETLRALPHADYCAFHQLLTLDELQRGEIEIRALLDKAARTLEDFDGPIDAIMGFWDFPVTLLAPILCQRFDDLLCPSLDARLACEHKYWSRLLQQRAAPEGCVAFNAVDPFADDPGADIDLEYPFWLKPVKSTSSMLASKVRDDAELADALEDIRAGIGRIGEPFDEILAMAELPDEIAELGGNVCIAEEEVAGIQCTVEGYASPEKIEIYGVVQSLHYPDSSSFYAYVYPALLPDAVTERMTDISRRVIAEIGLRRSPFNIEFFWDERHDRLAIIEVNPRHSQSHARLFELVDGFANHAVMLDLALGREPAIPFRQGDYPIAGKWFLRRFADGVVQQVPSDEDLAVLADQVSGTTIGLEAGPGDRLSDLPDQDSYSYCLAHLFIGAHDAEELQRKYDQAVSKLHFEIT